ncbi:Lar family restriction alleviation protein [Uliginosibacterium sediminicola]|uniref:Lar family restriction alleviation protein n=1 Tax=Uliginosibacterium sediminicola TaxID=2024550 RepID=A0ABU9YVW1_9RHOO
MSIILEPCPHCGAAAELDTHQNFRNFITGEIGRAISAYCTECSAEVSVCVSDVPSITPEQVSAMWNRRTSPAVPDELPDAVCAATAAALGGALDCGRVWSAWGVGTMSESDFYSVADDPERVAEISRAAITAFVGCIAEKNMHIATPAAQSGGLLMPTRGNKSGRDVLLNSFGLRHAAEQLLQRARAIELIATELEASPNLPTIAAKSILKSAGFGVIHQDTIQKIAQLVAWAKEQDADLCDDETLRLIQDGIDQAA